jgi:alginate export protein
MRRPAIAGLSALLLLPAAAGAQSSPPEEPKPAGGRKEDVPAGAEAAGEVSRRFNLDAQLRFRYEYAAPFSYAPPSGSTPAGTDFSDDAVFQRIRVGFDFRFHRMVGARIQIQDSRIWGEEGAANTTDNTATSVASSTDNLDLHQAYLDLNQLFEGGVGEEVVTFRLGRQELSYGDQRLVSSLDWSNVGRAWDAGRIIWTPQGSLADLRVDLFGSIIRDTAPGPTGLAVPTPTNLGADEKQVFSGLYATYPFQPLASWKWIAPGESQAAPVIQRHSVDGYVFYRHLADRGIFFSETGEEGVVNEFTAGGLWKGGIVGFDYSAEGAWQGGAYAGDDIRAYGFAVTAGYNLPPEFRAGLRSARLGVEYDLGSGDSNPSDGVRQTFDPLFPYGHAYQGFADIFSWKNGRDLLAKGTVELPRLGVLNPIWFEVQYHYFWLTDSHDAWYNAGLSQIRRDPTGTASTFVGNELDVHARYTLADFAGPASVSRPQKLWLWLGYSRFFAGDFVEETGPSPDRDFGYLQFELDL